MTASRDYEVEIVTAKGNPATSTIHCTSEAEAREPFRGSDSVSVKSVKAVPGTERKN